MRFVIASAAALLLAFPPAGAEAQARRGAASMAGRPQPDLASRYPGRGGQQYGRPPQGGVTMWNTPNGDGNYGGPGAGGGGGGGP